MGMVRYFLRVSYIGTKYRGTQKMQVGPDTETIQGIVESALLTLHPQNYPAVSFASRTDKGVHALMNTCHVDLDHKTHGEVYLPHYIRKKLNTYFTENNHEIIVTNACVVPDTFHSRFHARKRSYYYRIAVLKPEIQNASLHFCQEYLPILEVDRCHIVPSELNINIVKQVTDLYCGEHDFAFFTKYLLRDPWRKTVKVIDECSFNEVHDYKKIEDPQYSNISMWEFYIKSTGFLYHQVRKLVGVALSAGFGKMALSQVESLFTNPDPAQFSKCYLPPAGGLYLAKIEYDKKDFAGNVLSKSDSKDER